MNPEFLEQQDQQEQQEWQEQREREEACRTLPWTPAPVPPADRMLARRRHLLNEIDRGTPATASRRRVTFAVGAAVAAGAAVAVLLLGSPLPSDHSDPAGPPASAASVQLLERAALAAAARPQPAVRAGQYSYVRTVGHTTVLSENTSGGMDRIRESEDMEQWTSADGSRRTLVRVDGEDELLPGLPGKGGFHSPTYAFVAGLPTDPDDLLELIHDDAEKNHGPGSGSTTGPDQQAFVAIGDLLRGTVTPPATTAALYRAATRIPGVFVVPDAEDAAGRHGVAVARVHDGERSEWIFDRTTARLLGARTVLLEDSAWGKAGTVVGSIAITGSGITETAGQAP
ncbi:CU044_5270 family protein [Streptomyces sp. NPDC055103]